MISARSDDPVASHRRDWAKLIFAPIGHAAVALDGLTRDGRSWQKERMCVSLTGVGRRRAEVLA